MSTARLVGRQAEMAAVRDGLRRGSVVLTGERGVGRSALAAAIGTDTERRGGRVVRVVATAELQSVPFGALGFLLTDVDARVADDPARTIGRICAALRHGPTPPTVVIDDVHLLDAGSVAAIVQAIASRAASVVATVPADVALPDPLARLTVGGRLSTMTVGAFDRTAVGRAAAELLGSPVADATAELLWRWSGGLPGVLQGIVDAGRAAGRFRLRSGRWWWTGDLVAPSGQRLTVPGARADDRLGRALDDALDVVALADEEEVAEIERLVGTDPLVALERSGLVVTESRDGAVVVRCSTPLIRAQRLQEMSPLRRRTAAHRLLAGVAPRRTPLGIARRATWHLHADVPAAPGLLRDASAVVRLTDPALALRLAEANCRWHGGVAALADLVESHIENNDLPAAWTALRSMRTLAEHPEDAARVDASAFALTLFGERRPAGARRVVEAARRRGSVDRDELHSMDALIDLLEARTARAGHRARAVLARPGIHVRAELRAGVVEVATTMLAGQTAEALERARQVRSRAADHSILTPSFAGMTEAIAAFASIWRGDLRAAPPASPAAARWPAPPLVRAAGDGGRQFEWPLLAGITANLRGDHALAVRALRDAVVQQGSGKGMFHAEALAWLAVAQCDAGRPAAAAATLRDFPERHLGALPGVREWAEGVLACSRGDTRRACVLLGDAAESAHDAGAFLMEALYSVDLAERAGDEGPLSRLDALSRSLDAPLLQVMCRAAVARLKHDTDALIEHADTLAGFGVRARAIRAATDATRIARRADDPRTATRSAALGRSLRTSAVGVSDPGRTHPGSAAVSLLSRREAEVAVLAAGGLTDREIAARLVVSVRTVESHLSSAYRKLAISSRSQLEGALALAPA